MDIQELIKQKNIIIALSCEQLDEFATHILHGAKEIYEKKEIPEQYVRRKKAAEMLNKDESSLWRWEKQNYLKPVRVGKSVMYRLSDIKRIMGV